MAWEEASQSGTKSHRQTPSQGASEAGGPEVLQRFAPASPASPPLSHERPQLGKPRVHLLIWTWLSNPKPGTQGLTMNWILDGGEWRGGYTLHSDTSPGCTPETPGLTLPRVRACTGVSPEKQGPKRGPSSGQCRGVWMRTRGQ